MRRCKCCYEEDAEPVSEIVKESDPLHLDSPGVRISYQVHGAPLIKEMVCSKVNAEKFLDASNESVVFAKIKEIYH